MSQDEPTLWEISVHAPEETQQIGRLLGRSAQPGDVLLLMGELGAGKTTLAQGVGAGLGVAELLRSPSFVLIAEHLGRLPLYHIDLYRLDGVEETLELGLEEYLWGDGLSVIEWADRAPRAMPSEHLMVQIEHRGSESRRLRLEARGPRYQAQLRELAAQYRRAGSQT